MTDRMELLRREEEAWANFARRYAEVPEERLNESGVVPGWSTKDLVWHCAYWARFCAESLESNTTGEGWVDPFADHDDAYWDGVNAKIAEEAKAMSWGQIRDAIPAIRERVRAAVIAAPERGEVAEWFADETFLHYDEHAQEIQRFVAEA